MHAMRIHNKSRACRKGLGSVDENPIRLNRSFANNGIQANASRHARFRTRYWPRLGGADCRHIAASHTRGAKKRDEQVQQRVRLTLWAPATRYHLATRPFPVVEGSFSDN